MDCSRCGRTLPEEANFCWQCGSPIPRWAWERSAGWETCVIRLRPVRSPLLGRWTWQFSADLLGARTASGAYGSPTFKAKTTVTKRTLTTVSCIKPGATAEAVAALATLTDELARDGWEQVAEAPAGGEWSQQLFQRRLS